MKKKQAIGGAEDVLPPDILTFIREREAAIVNQIAASLEDFRLLVLAQGHAPAAIATTSGAEGQQHTYFCPKCSCGARLTVSFDSGAMQFVFKRSGSALEQTCEQALHKLAVAQFRQLGEAMIEREIRAYGIGMKRAGQVPDVGRLITTGQHDFKTRQYQPTPMTVVGQDEETDE